MTLVASLLERKYSLPKGTLLYNAERGRLKLGDHSGASGCLKTKQTHREIGTGVTTLAGH
jgi:hypothetical protein